MDIFWSIFFSLCCLDNDKPFCPFHICDFMVSLLYHDDTNKPWRWRWWWWIWTNRRMLGPQNTQGRLTNVLCRSITNYYLAMLVNRSPSVMSAAFGIGIVGRDRHTVYKLQACGMARRTLTGHSTTQPVNLPVSQHIYCWFVILSTANSGKQACTPILILQYALSLIYSLHACTFPS